MNSAQNSAHLSVHLQNFPEHFFKPDKTTTSQMDVVREVCSTALSIRKKFNLRARLPLAKLTIIGENALGLEPFRKFITDEANVKKIILDPNFTRQTETKIDILFEKAGKKFGKKMPEIVKAIKGGSWKKLSNGSVLAGGEILAPEDFIYKLVPTFEGENFESVGSDFLVVLDTEISETLEMEGLARDFIRAIQNERKVNKLEVNDRINLLYAGDARFEKMLSSNLAFIKEQCLILEAFKVKEDATFTYVDLEDTTSMVKLEKVS